MIGFELDLDLQPSVNCIVNLVPEFARRCECYGCRSLRGEEPAEILAALVAETARAKWRTVGGNESSADDADVRR